MWRIVITALMLLSAWVMPVAADEILQAVLAENRSAIVKPARSTVEVVVKALLQSGSSDAKTFLQKWRDREVWVRKADGQFFLVKPKGESYILFDVTSGAEAGLAEKAEVEQLKPNAGVKAVVTAALVQFQFSDPDVAVRSAALATIEKNADATQLEALRASIEGEKDPGLKARKQSLDRLLTIRFDPTPEKRIAAIKALAGDLSVEARSALTPILNTRRLAAVEMPSSANIARRLKPGSDISVEEAYALLVAAQLAPATMTESERNSALVANLKDGSSGGVPRDELDTEEARTRAYAALAASGLVKPFVPQAERESIVSKHVFFEQYSEPSSEVTGAATQALSDIETAILLNRTADLSLDAISLASIYFLAAIGLAITFGVMGVINMAHGEFIMMGAYTGYVVQQWIPDYTASLVVALPLAFVVTFAAGVVMERLVIRRLINRPLETLLATFGISIALQQLAKNIFGTQARPLTAPSWLDGSLAFNDIVSISYIRIAIFALAVIFMLLLLFILNFTRLGLEVRAVTQNRRMASSMGINPDRINMLTFGLGSGIAGIAGVAIGLFAQVTSEIGSNYIVQSFMAVVVGGVGNIWGTLAGASLIGVLQKIIEWFNPSNTLAAQTYMIIFIIIFIQFRPRGIIALRGRAAGD